MEASANHIFCLHCGAANPPRARFCSVCGHQKAAQQTNHMPALDYQAHQNLATQPSQAMPAIPPPSPAPVRLQRPTELIRQVSARLPALRPISPAQLPMLKQRYQLLKKLGSGGYGVVHKARDTEFGGRLVAIKEMSPTKTNGVNTQQAAEAFKHEAFMLAGLTHPNLPSIYDYFTDNGRWYLVMSYIEGETLEAYLNRSSGKKLPVEKVLLIGIQLAAVLNYLHTRKPPIIFRDLKPSNIMRIPDGQIYLIDFGIARHFKTGQAKDTAALGSPGYAAPEQYGRTQTTPQTDVYSLGATLHHMLTGIDPSDTPFNHAPLTLPDHPQLSILIACMLEMDPRKRPASMGNIKRELQRLFSSRPSSLSHDHTQQHVPAVSHIQQVGNKIWQALLPSPPSKAK
jgi:serine/threonine protein kinase